MSNNKTQNDDDIFDDVDFDTPDDVQDVQDLAESEDDSWEDVPGDGNAPNTGKNAGPVKAVKAGKKKSSGGFLIVIVLVLAAAGGGFYLFGNSSSPAPVNQEPQAAADAGTVPVEVTDQSAPPMPAPMDSGAPTTPDAGAESAPPPQLAATTELTPLPGTQDIAANTTPASAPESTEPVAKALPDVDAAAPATPVEQSAESSTPVAEPVAAQPAAEPVVTEPVAEPVQAETGSRMNVVPGETPAIQPMAEQIQQKSEPVAAPPSDSEALKRLESEKSDLEAKLSADDAQIETLRTTVEDLQSKLDDMVRQQAAEKSAKTEQPSVPETQNQTRNETPAPAPVLKGEPDSAPPAAGKPPAPAPAWVLRSVRNGHAVVSAKGSNEFRDISVGETLPGVGTVQSIGKVDGSWVVQGTQGRITR